MNLGSQSKHVTPRPSRPTALIISARFSNLENTALVTKISVYLDNIANGVTVRLFVIIARVIPGASL